MTKKQFLQQTVKSAGFIFAIFAFSLCETVHAMSDEEILEKFRDMESRIQAQQEQIEEQKQTIEVLKKQGEKQTAVPAPGKGVISAANREELKQVVADVIEESELIPGWLSGLHYSGDMRLRYEGIYNRNDRDDRHRGRFRLRLNVAKKLSEEIDMVFRLASASGPAITSSNQSFDDAFSKKDIWIDLAYASYRPNSLPGLKLAGGKLKNPFVHTDIIWDSDVNPEGVYEKYTFSLNDRMKPFVTLGQLFIYENNSTRDASLFAYQAGFDWKIGKGKWTLAAAYYDFTNLEDSQLVEDGKARGNSVKVRDGKEGLACDFNLVNLTTFWSTKLFDRPFKIYGDYVTNISSSCDDNNKAWAFGFSLGRTKKKGDWKLACKYARIEPDAVVGVFADANFGHANRQGGKVSLKYQLHPFILFGATAWITDSLRGHEDDITDLALDLILKF